jgi:ribosomal protein S18 acetylase RimI-like enzyme
MNAESTSKRKLAAVSELELLPICSVDSALGEVQSMYPDIDLASHPDFVAELNRIAIRGTLLLVHEVAGSSAEERVPYKCKDLGATGESSKFQSNAVLVEFDAEARFSRIHAIRTTAPPSAWGRFIARVLDRLEIDDTLEWVACCRPSDGLARTLRDIHFECRDEILQLWCPPERLARPNAVHEVEACSHEFSLRSTTQLDAEIQTLIAAVGKQNSDPTHSIRASCQVTKESGTNFVFCRQQCPIGLLQLDQPAENAALISYFGVLPEYRGRGIASTFFRRVIQQLAPTPQDGFMVAVGSRNTNGLQFFFRHGFQEAGRFELLIRQSRKN